MIHYKIIMNSSQIPLGRYESCWIDEEIFKQWYPELYQKIKKKDSKALKKARHEVTVLNRRMR